MASRSPVICVEMGIDQRCRDGLPPTEVWPSATVLWRFRGLWVGCDPHGACSRVHLARGCPHRGTPCLVRCERGSSLARGPSRCCYDWWMVMGNGTCSALPSLHAPLASSHTFGLCGGILLLTGGGCFSIIPTEHIPFRRSTIPELCVDSAATVMLPKPAGLNRSQHPLGIPPSGYST